MPAQGAPVLRCNVDTSRAQRAPCVSRARSGQLPEDHKLAFIYQGLVFVIDLLIEQGQDQHAGFVIESARERTL
jgi:hypothetical protein